MSQSILTEISKRKNSDWRRLSDPAIYRTLNLAALVGCLLGLLIFARYEAERIVRHDRVEMNVLAETVAPGIALQLGQGDLLVKEMAPLVEGALDVKFSARVRRDDRMRINERLFESNASGIAVVKAGGNVLDTFGELPAYGYLWPRSERTPGAGVELLRFISGDQAYIAYRSGVSVAGGASLVIVYTADAFATVLDGVTTPSLLFNREGELLTASGGVREYASGQDLDLLLEALTLSQSTSERESKLAALEKLLKESGAIYTNIVLPGGEAQIVTFRTQKGPLMILWGYRENLMLLLGPAILAILLALSLIQNEWRRQDKGDQDSDNMAARARVAGEIMSAGIIDWSVNEGAVSYSEGWAEMFGYVTPPQYEEVFDWIERIHPDDKLRTRSAYEELQNGTVDDLSHTIRVRAVNGEYRKIRERGRAQVDAAGLDRHVILVQMPT